MPVGSPLYVHRDCDQQLVEAVGRGEGTVLIHGPRQVGKTSLLGHTLNECRSDSVRVAITDFQLLGKEQLANAESCYRAVAYGLATQLGIPLNTPAAWNEWIGPNLNLHHFVETILAHVSGAVVWAMDEADRLFETPFADDFFGLVRSWHNRRAIDPHSAFNKLTLVIAYATEAQLFIQDINQSPFNVGLRIPVNDFDAREIHLLAERYGARLTDAEVKQLVGITGGQPFLTRRALDFLVLGGGTFKGLSDAASLEDGPFGEHLRRLLIVTSRDTGTVEEVMNFLQHRAISNGRTLMRLIAGGLLVRKPGGGLDFRVPSYGDFLRRALLS